MKRFIQKKVAKIIPLLGGVRGGSLGHEISVNISLITDLPTLKSPPKRGLFNLFINTYEIINFDFRGE